VAYRQGKDRYEQRKEMEIHSALDDDTMGVPAFTAPKYAPRTTTLYWPQGSCQSLEFNASRTDDPKDEQATLNSPHRRTEQFGTIQLKQSTLDDE